MVADGAIKWPCKMKIRPTGRCLPAPVPGLTEITGAFVPKPAEDARGNQLIPYNRARIDAREKNPATYRAVNRVTRT